MMVLKFHLQRSLSNNLLNYWLKARAWYHATWFDRNRVCRVDPPEFYELVFQDDFTEFDETEWRMGQPWGTVHPEHLDWYYPTDGTGIRTSNEGLELELAHDPKTFEKSDFPEWQRANLPERFTARHRGSLISSKQSWKYGWFECTAVMPKDTYAWPAFWTTGADSWPPEIDIFEGYTKHNKTDYKIKPNAHYINRSDKKTNAGAPTIPVNDPTGRQVQYAVEWTPDYIDYYYDGLRVMRLDSPDVMQNINSDEHFIIFNHGIQKNAPVAAGSWLQIKNFRVYQKQ